MPLDPEELNPTDRAILDELQDGRVTPAYVAETHGYSSGNVRNRMTLLASHDHVRGVGGGLYELVADPREDETNTDEADLRARLQDALESRDDAQAQARRLQDDLEDCRAQLKEAREVIVDVPALRRALDDIEAAAERGNGNGLQDALERAREAIDDAE